MKDFCRRHVSARLEIEVREPLEVVLQVEVADMAGTRRRESLTVTRDGEVLAAAGRDAADTAFLSMYGGAAMLLGSAVTAVLDGDLPADDVTRLVAIG